MQTQGLRDDRQQGQTELAANQSFFFGRKHIDQSLHRLRGAARVQGGQHQMAGLGGAQCEANGGQVAQFPDHDHVRVLAQRGSQSRVKAVAVSRYGALLHQTFRADMFKLDRVFECEYVQRLRGVDVVK